MVVLTLIVICIFHNFYNRSIHVYNLEVSLMLEKADIRHVNRESYVQRTHNLWMAVRREFELHQGSPLYYTIAQYCLFQE